MNNKAYKSLSVADVAEKLTEFSKNFEKLLICIHRSPDGDAVGSAFALKRIYEELSGTATVVCCDEAPKYLSFIINGQNTVKYTGKEEYTKIVTVDTASPSQMGDLEFLCEKVEFAIDHHEIHTEYSDNCTDGSASAAGEVLFEIYKHLVGSKRINENADICRAIFCAISADTGSFQYSNTTAKTHKIASELVNIINSDENGINTAEISRLIHNSRSMETLKAQKLCIEKLKFAMDRRIAYIILNNEDIRTEGLESEHFGAAIDIPRSVEGVLLSFVLKESDRSRENCTVTYKISTRSSCNVSVADICKKFGGGGHVKAAGGSITAKNEEEAVNAVLSEFENALKGE